MRAIRIIYDCRLPKCIFGEWERRSYLPKDSRDYQRCVDLAHENPESIRIVTVEHAGEEWAS